LFELFEPMKITNRIALFLIVMSLIQLGAITHAQSKGKDISDIRQYEQVLFHKRVPTLSDYYYWHGNGAEGEIQLVLNECRKNNLGTSIEDSKCQDFIRQREEIRDTTPSLYLLWLRTIVPMPKGDGVIEIKRIAHYGGANTYSHDLIYASIDGVPILLFRSTGPRSEIEHFGRLSISQIHGVPISQMLKDSLGRSIVETR